MRSSWKLRWLLGVKGQAYVTFSSAGTGDLRCMQGGSQHHSVILPQHSTQAFKSAEMGRDAKRWERGQAALRRYVQGQRFGRHFDDSVDLGQGHVTAYTLLVYLSGGCEDRGNPERLVGGETVFYGAPLYHCCELCIAVHAPCCLHCCVACSHLSRILVIFLCFGHMHELTSRMCA